jgi:hypothetical protein
MDSSPPIEIRAQYEQQMERATFNTSLPPGQPSIPPRHKKRLAGSCIWQGAWTRYRGGQTRPVWIARLTDSHIEAKIPRDNSNDFDRMWVGDTVYFLSDRNGAVTLFAYDTRSKKVTQVVKNNGLDIKSASADPGAIAYEQFGSLHLLDLKSHKVRNVEISISGDLAEVRPLGTCLWAGAIYPSRCG